MKLLGGVREWRSGKRALLYLLLISLAIKVTALLSADIINGDGVRYINAAQAFAMGSFREGIGIEKMPFYPLLIVAFHFLIKDWVLAGQLISLLAMLFALVPLFLLTRGLFDENVAFWAGLAFVLSPMMNARSVELIRDPLFLFFVAWTVYFSWRALTAPRCLFFVLASIASVFALLSRIEGFFLFVILGSVFLVLAIKKGAGGGPFFKGVAVYVGIPVVLGLGAGAVLSFATGVELTSFSRLGELTERFRSVISGDFLVMYRSLYAQLASFKNTAAVGTGGSLINTTRHYILLIYLLSLAEALAKNLFILYVIPLWVGFRKRHAFKHGHWLVLLLAGSYFLVAYYFLFTHDFISKRYLLVPAILLFPWVGLGLERIRSAIGGYRWFRTAMVLFLVIFCGIPAYKSLGDVFSPGKGAVIKVAGKWLASQPNLQKAVAACSDSRIRFYTSPEITFVKQMEDMVVAKDFRKMEAVASANKADLLIIETQKERRQHVPEFPEFSLLKEFVGTENVVLIYNRTI